MPRLLLLLLWVASRAAQLQLQVQALVLRPQARQLSLQRRRGALRHHEWSIYRHGVPACLLALLPLLLLPLLLLLLLGAGRARRAQAPLRPRGRLAAQDVVRKHRAQAVGQDRHGALPGERGRDDGRQGVGAPAGQAGRQAGRPVR